jgi:DNA-3-methyladenine glycosylase II
MEKDPHLSTLIERVKEVEVTFYDDGFSFLIFTITGQQVSAKVAETIYKRIVDYLQILTPENILKLDDITLRELGLSFRKIQTMKALASYVLDQAFNERSFHDEKCIQNFLSIKGIGSWTIDMYHMFVLKKLDYFSYKDLGLIQAMYHMYPLPIQDLSHMQTIIDKVSPYQSVLAHYLWAYWDIHHKKYLKKELK